MRATPLMMTLPILAAAPLWVGCEEKAQNEAAEVAGEAGKAAGEKAVDAAADKAGAAVAPAAPPAPPAPPPPPPMPSPAEICANLVGALKAKDDGKVMGLSTPASATALAPKEAKERVAHLLGEGTCGMAKVEEDKATVTVTSAGQPFDVAFVKLADGWKFDAVTFIEKNPIKPAHAGKKGKEAHPKAKHKK